MDRRLEGLDLNLLLALHWLLSERSVTAAAAQIGLSQPAASRALAKLRDAFGDPLLVKTGGEMIPTPLGEELRPVVAHAMEQCREVLRVPDPFDPVHAKGRFRIACTDDVGALIAKLWEEVIRSEAPGLSLDLSSPSLESARELATGKLDLCFLPEAPVLDLPPTIRIEDFVIRPVARHNFVSAVRANHPLAGHPLTLEEFLSLDHVLVAPAGKAEGFTDRALTERGYHRNIAYTTSSFLLALPIVMHTDCVLTGPQLLMGLMPKNLYIFEPPVKVPSFDLVIAWHPNWTQNSRHRFVRDRLHDAMSRIQADPSRLAEELA
ncbi:LysR family transcriptional regulator [Parvularcula marina]|uniref:LysR family transcriptional regulator n=1 Tax=Parvularcula marina TaxID=2292771 RepID=A0A371RIG3_9PROT|nr:LysR family transcriptional regulator [Parvularcula marina]RFB05230.1 LysR family transcriptional regulator [Parvularcula marina]